MASITTVKQLTDFGRTRLSKSFFMRDFLYSEIAAIHGLANLPSDPDLAIIAGTRLCEDLLEPLQDRFGRITIRSAYRSAEVNALGCQMQAAGKRAYSCASNESNYASHIWDRRDRNGCIGATACIVIPSFIDQFRDAGDWQKLAWWVHDSLPYANLYFFPVNWAFNISWHERPQRRIDSYVAPRGCLTKPGMANHPGSHREIWEGINTVLRRSL